MELHQHNSFKDFKNGKKYHKGQDGVFDRMKQQIICCKEAKRSKELDSQSNEKNVQEKRLIDAPAIIIATKQSEAKKQKKAGPTNKQIGFVSRQKTHYAQYQNKIKGQLGGFLYKLAILSHHKQN
ncbi:MAG: hypothetical protein SFW35_10560 [Chitinophagales bacterium]|nr:hypothetical protein [Chitinophagales bacterium]